MQGYPYISTTLQAELPIRDQMFKYLNLLEALLIQAKTESSGVKCTIFLLNLWKQEWNFFLYFIIFLSFGDIEHGKVIYTFNFCILILVPTWPTFLFSIIKV